MRQIIVLFFSGQEAKYISPLISYCMTIMLQIWILILYLITHFKAQIIEKIQQLVVAYYQLGSNGTDDLEDLQER